MASEISAITEKASPVSADLIIIEDSASSNAKKKVQIGNLPTGNDTDAVHVDVAAEMSGVTEKASPVSADLLLIEDSAASNAKKRVQIGNLPTGDDSNAIHDDEAGEINALTGVTAASNDVVIIEDYGDSFNKKKVTAQSIADLGAGGADGTAIHDDTANEISAITEKTTPADADLVIIEDSAASYVKKKVQVQNLPGGGTGGTDVVTVTSTTYTATAANRIYLVDTDTAGGNVTLTMPSAAAVEGEVTVKRLGSYQVIIQRAGSDTFDLATTTQRTLFNEYAAAKFFSPGSGTKWYQLGEYGNVT